MCEVGGAGIGSSAVDSSRVGMTLSKDYGDSSSTWNSSRGLISNFGSGWTWLVEEGGALKIVNTTGAGTPLTTPTQTALLTVDVWEHAYYLDYQNLRAKFVQTFFDKLVNWDFAAANMG